MGSWCYRRHPVATSGANGIERMLRSPKQEDAELLAPIRSDFRLQHLLMSNPPGSPKGDILALTSEWINRRMAQGWFKIIQDDALIVAGFAQISDIHRENRLGWLGLGLLPSARGKGLGRRAMIEIESAARNDLGLRKLLLQVRCDNMRAIAMYDRGGWRRVGFLKEHYYDRTRTYDVILFEKLLSVQ